jgi:arylsulfatase A-like enzyme
VKPNVLFIAIDDLNAWIGILGRNPDVRTPNIDALAARGTLFTHAYTCAPYCNAGRMGVLTGCIPSTTGFYANEPFWDASGRAKTLVECFKEAGYYTAGAGKVLHGTYDYLTATRTGAPNAVWQESMNRSFIWDEFQTCVPDVLPDARPLNKLFDFTKPDEVSPWSSLFDWGPMPGDRVEQMPDEEVVRTFSRFISKPPREPFFFATGLYKRHLPWHVPQHFFDLYVPEALSLPLVKQDDLDDVPEIARQWALSPPDHHLITRGNQWRQAVRGYLASVSYCDYTVGRIVAALDASGAADNTIIVLWADHGFHLGEKLHWRKFALWEEATRVPFIFVRPGEHARNNRMHDPVSTTDIFPTLLCACDIEPPATIDGENLCEALLGSELARSRPVTTTWGSGNHSLRTPSWRFTRYNDGTEELYDHRIDPHEWTNLASIAAFDEIRQGFRGFLPSEDLDQIPPA